MFTPTSLQQLKNKRLVWQAKESKQAEQPNGVSSHYPELDKKLDGGWPNSGVVEININQYGCGELRLIMPALSQLQEQDKLQAWVSPPERLNPLALSHMDISLEQTLVTTPSNLKQSYWVVEQLLRSGCCSAIVFWCKQLEPQQAKRLQLHAKQNHCLLFIIRKTSTKHTQQSLPISLRMRIQAQADGLHVDIFKRQNQWPIEPFWLDMQAQWPHLHMPRVAIQSEIEATPEPAYSNVIPFPFDSSSSC